MPSEKRYSNTFSAVADRTYAYTSLAAYEAIYHAKPNELSLAEQMNEFGKMPGPGAGKEYDFTLLLPRLFFTTAQKVVFLSVEYTVSCISLYKELGYTVK